MDDSATLFPAQYEGLVVRVVAVLLLVAALAAGCLSEPPAGADSSSSFTLGGTFTEAATQDDVTELSEKFQSLGAGDVAILESFPMQFRASAFPRESACAEARAWAELQPYVRDVGQCAPSSTSVGDPDAPTSSSSR